MNKLFVNVSHKNRAMINLSEPTKVVHAFFCRLSLFLGQVLQLWLIVFSELSLVIII